MEQLIQAGLAAQDLAVPADAAAKLAMYGQLLIEKNQVMNLTAITAPDEVARLHFLDCASILGCADLRDKTLIDVGTGAGFPGMVLKILVPSLKLTLMDGLQKRLTWLEELCEVLSLDGVQFCHARAEERGHDPAFRETFDFATARAVASLGVLSELCLPYVKIGGQFLAMKTIDSDEELNASASAIAQLGGQLTTSYDYVIPETDISRRLIRINKIAITPSQYPRRWARIQKKSL